MYVPVILSRHYATNSVWADWHGRNLYLFVCYPIWPSVRKFDEWVVLISVIFWRKFILSIISSISLLIKGFRQNQEFICVSAICTVESSFVMFIICFMGQMKYLIFPEVANLSRAHGIASGKRLGQQPSQQQTLAPKVMILQMKSFLLLKLLTRQEIQCFWFHDHNIYWTSPSFQNFCKLLPICWQMCQHRPKN